MMIGRQTRASGLRSHLFSTGSAVNRFIFLLHQVQLVMPSGNRLLYHGTERPEIVLNNGLKPDQPESRAGGNPVEGCVHLTTSWDMALTFGTPLVVQVPDPSKLTVDPLATHKDDVWDKYEKSYVYPDEIPPRRITVIPNDRANSWFDQEALEVHE